MEGFINLFIVGVNIVGVCLAPYKSIDERRRVSREGMRKIRLKRKMDALYNEDADSKYKPD